MDEYTLDEELKVAAEKCKDLGLDRAAMRLLGTLGPEQVLFTLSAEEWDIDLGPGDHVRLSHSFNVYGNITRIRSRGKRCRLAMARGVRQIVPADDGDCDDLSINDCHFNIPFSPDVSLVIDCQMLEEGNPIFDFYGYCSDKRFNDNETEDWIERLCLFFLKERE